MFCSKCGKEIMNEAVICPHCGCPTSNYLPQQPVKQAVETCSDDHLAIRRFAQETLTLRNLGIVAAILMFGIGIIFSIIIWVKNSRLTEPKITTTNPAEVMEFENAKRHRNTAYRLSMLPMLVISIAVVVVSITSLSVMF